MINSIKTCLIYFVAGLSLSCQFHNRRADNNVLDVLSGFTFVGSGQAKFNDDGSVDTTYLISHSETGQPKPQNIMQGIQYVFHHKGPIDDESLALRDFPNMIESMGFKILKAPKSANELLYLYFGGPLFYIEFSDGSREFALFNQLVTSPHSEDLGVHDYILIRIR
jgi:hypothetical protein